MRAKPIYFMIIVIFLITACSSGDNNNAVNDEFVGSRDFTFNTAIDSTILTQEDSFRIYETSIAPRDEAYAIENDANLDAFNQTLAADEQISLTDLDTYTYYVIRDPGCPDYFDYSNHSYNNNLLTITLDHFHVPNVVCLSIIEELYLVFKAKKNS